MVFVTSFKNIFQIYEVDQCDYWNVVIPYIEKYYLTDQE